MCTSKFTKFSFIDNSSISLKKTSTNVLPPVLPNVNNNGLIRPMSVENGLHKSQSLASSSVNSVANSQSQSQNSPARNEFKTNFATHSQHIIDMSKKANNEKNKVITVIYASVKENRIFLMFFFSVNKE
jgi:hypothetical protein